MWQYYETELGLEVQLSGRFSALLISTFDERTFIQLILASDQLWIVFTFLCRGNNPFHDSNYVSRATFISVDGKTISFKRSNYFLKSHQYCLC
jgi:hypothetical protein